MSLTSGELTAVAEEINARGGRRIEKIYAPSPTELSIIFREDKKLRLHIDCSTYAGSIFLTEGRSQNPERPDGFTFLLRKHLSGMRLERIETGPNDRQAALIFHPSGERLYCRFFGSGGFLLTDAEGTIIANHGYKHIPPLRPGQTFTPESNMDGGEELSPAGFTGSPSEELEKRHEAERLDGKRKLLLSAISTERKKLTKLLRSLTADMEKLERYSEGQRLGDLCRSNFHLLKPGMESITVTDYATGEEVTIELDSTLPPNSNVERFYKQMKKYRSGKETVAGRITEAETKLEKLETVAGKADAAGTVEELEPLWKHLPKKAAEHAENLKSGGKKDKADKNKDGFKVIHLDGGWIVHLGRNDTQNDLLVRRSNGNDHWFHLHGFPGAHVVLKSRGKQPVPRHILEEAARIALRHSSKADDKKGTIIYTQVKNLRKPKGAGPGKVLVTREKAITVSLD